MKLDVRGREDVYAVARTSPRVAWQVGYVKVCEREGEGEGEREGVGEREVEGEDEGAEALVLLQPEALVLLQPEALVLLLMQ